MVSAREVVGHCGQWDEFHGHTVCAAITLEHAVLVDDAEAIDLRNVAVPVRGKQRHHPIAEPECICTAVGSREDDNALRDVECRRLIGEGPRPDGRAVHVVRLEPNRLVGGVRASD